MRPEREQNTRSTPDPAATESALDAACDRICGVHAKYHKDRCPLYKANCRAMDAWNAKGAR